MQQFVKCMGGNGVRGDGSYGFGGPGPMWDHSRVQRKSPNTVPPCAHGQLHGVRKQSQGPPDLSKVGRDRESCLGAISWGGVVGGCRHEGQEQGSCAK